MATSNLGISLGGYQTRNTLILPWHLHTQQHPGGSLWLSFLPAVCHCHFCPGKPAQHHPGKRAVKENEDKCGSQKALGDRELEGQEVFQRLVSIWFIFYLGCLNLSRSLCVLCSTAVQSVPWASPVMGPGKPRMSRVRSC